MATDFWASSHYKRWLVDRATLKQARADDLVYVPEPEYLDFLAIYFANRKKLQLRQRVVATATVFFRRFYLKNSYCETDPYLVLSACCYVAAKAEESPVHIKNVVAESRALFSQEQYNVKHFPSDNSKLAEMEFYLVDDLECDLVVFHPYRTLLALCRKDSASSSSGGHSESPTEEAEAGELGAGIGAEDGPRYWGTGEGKLELSEGALQTAWFIINDTYRSELCLLYPPHLIAVTAIYLTLVLHTPTMNAIAHLLPYSSAFNSDSAILSESPQATPQPRRSSRTSDPSSKQTQDPIAFLADLNISLSAISTIAQEIISMYNLWSRYREDLTNEEMRSMNMSSTGVGRRSATGHSKSTTTTVRGHRGPQNPRNQKNPLPRNPSASTSTSELEWQRERQRLQGAMQLQAHANAMATFKKQGYVVPVPVPVPAQAQASSSQMINSMPHFYIPPHAQLPQFPQQQQTQAHHRYPPVLAPVSLGSLSPTKKFTTAGVGSGSGSGSGTPNSVGGGRMEDLFGDGTSSGSPGSHTSYAGNGPGPGIGTGIGSSQRASSTPLGNTPGSSDEIASSSNNNNNNPWPFGQGRLVTAVFLSSMLNSMREARMSDMAHPPNARPIAVNRMLERTG